MKKLHKGFTLIELLVVISIIALLSTLAVVSLNSTRAKARDAKRITDIKQIQTALELFYASESPQAYPVATASVELGVGSQLCLGDVGFGAVSGTAGCGGTVYMGQVPEDPEGTEVYAYTSADGSTYNIVFELEGNTGSLTGPGTHTANPAGIE